MHLGQQITYKKYKAKIVYIDPGSVIIEIYDYGRYGTVQKGVDVKEIDVYVEKQNNPSTD